MSRRLVEPGLYGLDVAGAAAYLRSQDDGEFAADAKTLHAATKSPKRLIIVPGTDHGVAFVDPGGVPSVRKAVEDFLAKHAR